MAALYPLRFHPLFRHYLWGGDKLRTLLGKPIGDQATCAESWEICDRGQDQSIVAAGPLTGQTLSRDRSDATAENSSAGTRRSRNFRCSSSFSTRATKLSVQVHPDDHRAAQLTPPDLGKTEAWVVMDAEPASAHLRRPEARLRSRGARARDRPRHLRALSAQLCAAAGRLRLLARRRRACDRRRLARGRDSAIERHHLAAVRLESSGAGRPAARRCTWPKRSTRSIMRRGPVSPARPSATDDSQRERWCRCDKFVLDRWRLAEPQQLADDDRFHILAVLAGAVTRDWRPRRATAEIGRHAAGARRTALRLR